MSKVINFAEKQKEQQTIVEVLGHLMAKANINLFQLSKNTGLSYTTVKRMCSDENSNPTLASVKKIADFFKISANQLMGEEPLYEDAEGLATYKPSLNTWENVPVLSLKQAVAWPENIDQIKDATETTFTKTDLNIHETTFAVVVKDDSLEPRFSAGTVLIFDPEKEMKSKDYVLIHTANKDLPQFRQILIDGPDMYVKSVNPELGDNSPTPLNTTTTKIIGVLIQAKSDFLS